MTSDFNPTASKRVVYPPFVRPDPAAREMEDSRPIGEFTDELPQIEDFLISESEEEGDEDLPWIDELAPSDTDVEGWAISEWQSYDWSSLAGLGRDSEERAAAEAEWSATDWTRDSWELDSSDASQSRSEDLSAARPDAHEIARALDAIARRLRSGELAIDELHAGMPESAIANALAALVRLRG